MNKYLIRVAKKVLPQPVKDFIIRKRKKRSDERKVKDTLMQYENICNSNIPGFIVLDSYVKTDRIFDGIQYYSQVYQDYYLDHYIFHGKENGIFLDIGGNDPVKINNTYFFEVNRNWTGLAFEPMPKMNQRWRELRKVKCMQVALGRQSGETEFCEYEDDYMSGIVSAVDYKGKVANRYKVKVERLESILRHHKITHVDFMSIDVEGVELDVLSGINFDEVSIDYIVIENNKGVKRERLIREFLFRHGYVLNAKLWIDEIWKKKTD